MISPKNIPHKSNYVENPSTPSYQSPSAWTIGVVLRLSKAPASLSPPPRQQRPQRLRHRWPRQPARGRTAAWTKADWEGDFMEKGKTHTVMAQLTVTNGILPPITMVIYIYIYISLLVHTVLYIIIMLIYINIYIYIHD